MTPRREVRKTIESIPLFKGISPETLEQLSQEARMRSYRKQEAVCHMEDYNEGVSYLLEGLALLAIPDNAGKKLIGFKLLTAGEWFGELYCPKHDMTIIALEPCNVLTFPKSLFLPLLQAHPQIAQQMLALAHERLSHLLNHMKCIQFGNTHERVARVLLSLARQHGKPHPQGICIHPRITQKTLGMLTGLRRESVTQVMGAFRDAACLTEDADHRWILVDRERLEREGA